MGSGICLNVFAGCLHDHADSDEQQRADESLQAATDVDGLADAEQDHTADDSSGNVDGRQQAVLPKGTRHVRVQRTFDGSQHGGDEGDEPKTVAEALGSAHVPSHPSFPPRILEDGTTNAAKVSHSILRLQTWVTASTALTPSWTCAEPSSDVSSAVVRFSFGTGPIFSELW